MDTLPAEILHVVFSKLTTEDIQSMRLVNKRCSDIGAYYLLSEVSFFMSRESLERLQWLSQHPTLSQQVRTIRYQANVLQEISNPEVFKDYMNVPHDHDRYPVQPGPSASDREWRLFERNREKWRFGGEVLSTRQLKGRISSYAQICAAQKADIESGIDQRILAEAIPRFSNLRNMFFTARPTCCHAYKERYMERFKELAITPPTKPNTEFTVSQLSSYLNPLAGTQIRLEVFRAAHVSPEIFQFPKFKGQLKAIQPNLAQVKECVLNFKLDANKTEWLHLDGGPEKCFKVLKPGGLPKLLASMPQLRHLSVSFDDCPCSTKVPLQQIVGTNRWPNLEDLALSQFSATEDSLLKFLVEHVDSLRRVRLSNPVLSRGSWIKVTREMKAQLKLARAQFTETLRGSQPHENWDMRSLNIEYTGPFGVGYTTLSEDLNHYITSNGDEEDMDFPDAMSTTSEDADMSDVGIMSTSTNPLEEDSMYVDPSEVDDYDGLPEQLAAIEAAAEIAEEESYW
ncbi:hypothetical protein UCRPC4_g04128 [Phaeomoniella chlamydospora]|uniref:F-box domain-containing protein n=1 Tax=Phaeomoniella chlamydospora TaxID=158046 RepID=A0A0G2EEQ7_PHACM|nr:hypothetical protein UCRPC4_g04128 [Phaeomoniella chlamydospora]